MSSALHCCGCRALSSALGQFSGAKSAKLQSSVQGRSIAYKAGGCVDYKRLVKHQSSLQGESIAYRPWGSVNHKRLEKVRTRSGVMASAAVVVDEADSHARTPIPPPAHPSYELSTIIQLALTEDAGDRGDVTCLATIPPATQAEAQFLAKADGVLAGVAVADAVFQQVDPELRVEWSARDGDLITKGQHFGTIKGNARSILTAERIALNFMQRMSGIATATTKMAEAARPARILETRKTAPGLRLIDKWAVLIGGGENHRMGLFDMVMIKDNHIAAAGGIEAAVAAAREYLREHELDMGVEVETRTLDEVAAVLECLGEGRGRVTRIMLDNMVTVSADGDVDTDMLRMAVRLIDGRCETEASGNVTLATVNAIGATGVTFISSGALTHSVTALDISLNIDTELALEVGRRTNTA